MLLQCMMVYSLGHDKKKNGSLQGNTVIVLQLHTVTEQ